MASKVFDRGKPLHTESEKAVEMSTSQQLALKLQQGEKSLRETRQTALDDHWARLEKPGNNGEMHSKATPSIPSSGMFLELFAGTGRLTSAVRALSKATLTPVELKDGALFDLRRRSIQETVLSWIRSGRVAFVRLGTPCTVFSRARHWIKHRQRAAEKERVGLEMALFTAEVIQTCRRYIRCIGALKTPDIVDFLMSLFCVRFCIQLVATLLI